MDVLHVDSLCEVWNYLTVEFVTLETKHIQERIYCNILLQLLGHNKVECS